MATIDLTSSDIDYIGRVVATEVPGYLAYTNPQAYRDMVGAVVDTVLNRVETGRFGDTVEDVLNQDRAFSKITGPSRLDPYGSIEDTPKASARVQQEVNEHIASRARGKQSKINGAVNYANPLYSDQKNLTGWIEPMIEAGAQRFGYGKAQHYHGNAPGQRPAGFYNVTTPVGFMPPVEFDQLLNTPMVPSRAPPTMAAPFGVVERAPLSSVEDVAKAKAYGDYARSRTMSPDRPDNHNYGGPKLTPEQDYFGPRASIPTASGPINIESTGRVRTGVGVSGRGALSIAPPAIDQTRVQSVPGRQSNLMAPPTIDTMTRQQANEIANASQGRRGPSLAGIDPQSMAAPMTGFEESIPAVPAPGFPEPPPAPGRTARTEAAKGAVLGGLKGGIPGAILGAIMAPGMAQIRGNIASNRVGIGQRINPLTGILGAYRGMLGPRGGGSIFSGIPAPNYSATPYSVGSGYGAIGSVFGAPAGATAYSRSNPSVSFTSLGNGYVSRANRDYGTTQTLAPGDYDAGMFSGRSDRSKK